jgi:hypothetical protein
MSIHWHTSHVGPPVLRAAIAFPFVRRQIEINRQTSLLFKALAADNCGKPCEGLVVRSAINSFVGAAAAKHSWERMLARARAFTADDAGS